MSAMTPAFGPTALIVPAAHRRYKWSYRFGVQAQQRGEPQRTDFGVWDDGDRLAYCQGFKDAATGAVRQKGQG